MLQACCVKCEESRQVDCNHARTLQTLLHIAVETHGCWKPGSPPAQWPESTHQATPGCCWRGPQIARHVEACACPASCLAGHLQVWQLQQGQSVAKKHESGCMAWHCMPGIDIWQNAKKKTTRTVEAVAGQVYHPERAPGALAIPVRKRTLQLVVCLQCGVGQDAGRWVGGWAGEMGGGGEGGYVIASSWHQHVSCIARGQSAECCSKVAIPIAGYLTRISVWRRGKEFLPAQSDGTVPSNLLPSRLRVTRA